MTDHRVLVFSTGPEGSAAAPDDVVRDVPGCVAARRYRCSEHQRSTAIECPWPSLTMYDLETDDLAGAYAAIEALPSPDGIASGSGHRSVAWTYTEFWPMLKESPGAAARKTDLGHGEHEFVILTNPAEGREADFLRWYDAHIPEILDHYHGLTTGQLFKAATAQAAGTELEWQYLALYDLRAADVGEYFNIEPHDLEGMTQIDGALGPRPAQWVFTPIGPGARRADLEPAPASAGA